MAEPPDSVLFACNRNSVRSVVAAALLRQRQGARTFVDSCGLKPGDAVDPFAAAVMAELGLDIAEHHPKSFDQLDDDSFDLVVSLTPEAHHRAVELTRGRATELEYWPIADPTLETGSREQRLAAYRAMRQEIARRIAERFPAGRGFGG